MKGPPQLSQTDPLAQLIGHPQTRVIDATFWLKVRDKALAGRITDEATVRVDGLLLTAKLAMSAIESKADISFKSETSAS